MALAQQYDEQFYFPNLGVEFNVIDKQAMNTIYALASQQTLNISSAGSPSDCLFECYARL